MTFLNANVILYERQFGFRHNHLTTHVLSAITEKIRQVCVSENFACGVSPPFYYRPALTTLGKNNK